MEINLNELAGGGLSDRINRELQKVAENVLDPNTKADAVRTLTITLKIKPNENRQVGTAEFVVKSALVPPKGLPSMFVFDYDSEGKAVLAELTTGSDKNQLAVNDQGKVVDGTGSEVQEKKVINGHFR